jgi:hypothetical protein
LDLYSVKEQIIQIITAMFTENKVTEIYCLADDFCKFFDSLMKRYSIKDQRTLNKRKYHRSSTLSQSELMLIIILFYSSGYKYLKYYYQDYVCIHLRHIFPRVVSYNRFVELKKDVALPLALFIKKVLLGKCIGISFVDSTPLRICRSQGSSCIKFLKE